jgi:hypothetical protein
LIILSCQRELDFEDIYPEDEVVVNSLFTTDSSWFVHLTWSKSILEQSGNYRPVPGPSADVRIKDEFGQVVDLVSLGNGWFGTSEIGIEMEVDYHLDVEVQGREQLRSHDRIPDTTQILSIDHNSSNNFTEEQIRFEIEFEDEPGEDFYYLEVYNSNEFNSGQSGYEILAINGNFQPIYPELFGQDYFYQRAYVTDEGMDGRRIRLDFIVPQYYSEGYVVIRLVRPSRNAYLYSYSTEVQSVSEFNPFAQPAIIHTNIDNGIGIFAGSSFVERRFKIGP